MASPGLLDPEHSWEVPNTVLSFRDEYKHLEPLWVNAVVRVILTWGHHFGTQAWRDLEKQKHTVSHRDLTLHLVHSGENFHWPIIQNPCDYKRLAFVSILLFKFFAVSLESLISFNLNEYFIIFVFAVGIPEMILDIVGVNLLEIFSPLLLHLNVKVHSYFGATPTWDHCVVLLVAQSLLGEFQLQL